ncbi:hypothetical protein C5O22_02860 [Treponema sp. J25]|nr:hypothetical protein C5O22_02860 [Treponema sp. J25]
MNPGWAWLYESPCRLLRGRTKDPFLRLMEDGEACKGVSGRKGLFVRWSGRDPSPHGLPGIGRKVRFFLQRERKGLSQVVCRG